MQSETALDHSWDQLRNDRLDRVSWRREPRMGFAFCGLDTALYHGTESEGEQAIYMSMPWP